jgi:hypothetical protein
MRTNRKLNMLVAAVLALALASVAMAGPGKRFAHGKDEGTNPVATAGGITEKPHAIYAEITSKPSNMRVGAKWTTVCSKNQETGTRGHTFLSTTPVRKKLKLRFRNPEACQATTIARMKGTGTVKVALYAKRQ